MRPTSTNAADRCWCVTVKGTSAAKLAWTSSGSNSWERGSRSACCCRPGPLFCVIDGRTRGRRWAATAARAELRQLAVAAGVRRRFAPHQLRHAHAVELAREGVAVTIIQRQLGHRPRHHQHLPPRDRSQRDHRRRPVPQTTHHLGHRRTRALTTPRGNDIEELRRPPAGRAGRSDWLVLRRRRGWMQR